MYKNIWFKLHLILGLSAGFILLIVGFTGSMLSFEKEILSAINQDTYKVTVFDQAKLSTKEFPINTHKYFILVLHITTLFLILLLKFDSENNLIFLL